ncbi:MAG: hypothetical protein FJ308_17150 [Planctomycetes bacterium]|nr:hypothetical protein [Planctomycetota bacterium]
MLNPQQVIETYFLENRHMLLELAAFLDRYEVAVARQGEHAADEKKLAVICQAIEVLSRTGSDTPRVEQLLELFAAV